MLARASSVCGCDGEPREMTFSYTEPPAGETRFDLRGQSYRRHYERCSGCGHWYGVHDIDLSGLYGSDYINATYGDIEGVRRRFEQIMALPPERSDNRQRVARILRFAASHGPNGGRVLDIGAGIGVFAAAMREAGWSPIGIELDPRSLEHLKQNVGIRAFNRDIFMLSQGDIGAFDLVTLIKVLEHVEDPAPMLAQAATLLAPDGHVYIEVPDVAAQQDGPGREEFFIEHHHVFSARSLAALIARAGGRTVELEGLREPSGKYTLRAFAAFHK